ADEAAGRSRQDTRRCRLRIARGRRVVAIDRALAVAGRRARRDGGGLDRIEILMVVPTGGRDVHVPEEDRKGRRVRLLAGDERVSADRLILREGTDGGLR